MIPGPLWWQRSIQSWHNGSAVFCQNSSCASSLCRPVRASNLGAEPDQELPSSFACFQDSKRLAPNFSRGPCCERIRSNSSQSIKWQFNLSRPLVGWAVWEAHRPCQIGIVQRHRTTLPLLEWAWSVAQHGGDPQQPANVLCRGWCAVPFFDPQYYDVWSRPR